MANGPRMPRRASAADDRFGGAEISEGGGAGRAPSGDAAAGPPVTPGVVMTVKRLFLQIAPGGE